MKSGPAIGPTFPGALALLMAPRPIGAVPPAGPSEGFARELLSPVRTAPDPDCARRPVEAPSEPITGARSPEPSGALPWAMLPALVPPSLPPSPPLPEHAGQKRPPPLVQPHERPMVRGLEGPAPRVLGELPRAAIVAWETHIVRHAAEVAAPVVRELLVRADLPVVDDARAAAEVAVPEAAPSTEGIPARERTPSQELAPQDEVALEEGIAAVPEGVSPDAASVVRSSAPSEPGPLRPPAREVPLTPELAEVPLPPALEREQVRIRLDRQLSVEISAQGHRVEVTLSGSAHALEPLKAIAPELGQSLRQDGFLLESFQARSDGQGEASTSQHSSGQHQREPSPERRSERGATPAARTTAPRGPSRGGRYA